MSSFFTLDSETSQVRVSSNFWIFWAIAIPLTLLVISIWALWIQRTEVMRTWQRLWRKARQRPRARKVEEIYEEIEDGTRDEARLYEQPSRAVSDQQLGHSVPQQQGRLLHRYTV